MLLTMIGEGSMTFYRGDIVKVCKEMPSYMSHFESDYKALVEEVSGNSIALRNLKTGGYSAWYEPNQLTFIKRIKEETIKKTKERLKPVWDRRRKQQESKTSKEIIKIVLRKKKYPEGTIARTYQDAFDNIFKPNNKD